MDPFAKFILRLTVVVTTILYHQNMTLKAITDAKLFVLPLWNTSGSGSDFCHVDNSNADDGLISLQGDPNHRCSLQIHAPPQSLTSIRLEGNNSAENFLYIERKGSPGKCSNRYVAIEGQNQGCSALFAHKQLELNIYGNVSVLIRGMQIAEVLFNCPESDLNSQTEVESNPMCYAKGYEKMITCATQNGYEEQNEGVCHVKFMSYCIAFLYDRKVIFQCMNEGISQNETWLLLYPPGLSKLFLNENNIVQIDENAFQYVRDLPRLILWGNQLKYIPRYAFRGLTHLNFLDLSRNNLNALPVGIFDDLEEIIYLYLYENRLMVLGESMFQRVTRVQHISLKNNRFRELPSKMFQGLANLTYLDLARNKLKTFPVGIFDDLDEIIYLYLYENRLMALDEDMFQGVTKVQWIRLENNSLFEIPSKLFQGLTHLTYLDLGGNRLNMLPAGIFHGLRNIKTLYLDNNQLISINETLFHDMKKCTTLKLWNNNLNEIPPKLFQGLSHLRELDLYGNNLTFLNPDIFKGLTNLIKLVLSRNMLTALSGNLFQDLHNLNVLFITFNRLRYLSHNLFKGLRNLTNLSLRGNHLQSLDADIFKDLSSLTELSLVANKLGLFPTKLFQNLGNLKILNAQNNQQEVLKVELFNGAPDLVYISFSGNRLSSLPRTLFEKVKGLREIYFNNNTLRNFDFDLLHGLSNLTIIDFGSNKIQELDGRLFNGLINLEVIGMSDNKLRKLDPYLFKGLNSLKGVYLAHNQLSELDQKVFKDAPNLGHINFSGNRLTSLPRRLFAKAKGLRQIYFNNNTLRNLDFDLLQGLSNLTIIGFTSNEIQELDGRLFNGLTNLESIGLSNNKLRKLDSHLFKGLNSLQDVFLANNQLSELDEGIFKDTPEAKHISLRGNRLVKLFNFKKMINLIFLDIVFNSLTDVNTKSFEGLSRKAEVIVSQHEICKCYIPDYIKCSASDDRSPYLTCKRLLSDRILVILMWLIGINALGGNIFVLAWRRKSSQKNKIQDILLSNLALSDLLMGLYMLMIASADIYFGQSFPMQSESWRSGITCRSAGALSIISSEASVFFVTLISIDRFICIRFPFSSHKLDGRLVTVTATITWIVSFTLGIVPSSLSGKNFKFYDNSHVCIGLPLTLIERFHQDAIQTTIFYEGGQTDQETFNTTSLGYERGLYFSSSLFLGLNCLCYFVIFACYVEIVRAVFKSARKAKLNKEMKDQVQMTAKVAAIVATDFCCWFPIILMGILVQTRVVTLPPTVYDWSVTFVLPINSAINPYLYTVSAIIGDRKKQNTLKVPAASAPSCATVSQQQQNVSSVTEDTHL